MLTLNFHKFSQFLAFRARENQLIASKVANTNVIKNTSEFYAKGLFEDDAWGLTELNFRVFQFVLR